MISLRALALPVILLFCIASIYVPIALAQENFAPPTLTFTTIDVPGAMNTNVLGISSAGQLVGYYATTTTGPASGFLLSGGNFTFFNYPGGYSTEPVGINDSGLISGTAYIAQGTASVGFLYDGTNFTTISVPGRQHTVIDGINNAGDVVGGDGAASINQAFELIGTRFHNVTPPPGGWTTAIATRVNNLSEIVGLTTGTSTTGFIFRGGKFQTITFPGSLTTTAWGVNDTRIVTGTYSECSPCTFHGFALMNGKYLTISYPGAEATYAFGIGNTGQIVGSYTFDQQTFHGFVTSPITAVDFEDTASVQ